MTDPFVHLDIGQLARDLELEVHAKEHAEADNPLSLATNPGSIEREAVEQATKAYRRAEREATDQFQTYDERVASLGLLSNLSTIGVKATQADGEMSTAIMNVSNRLANAKTAISVSYDHLNAFQKQNGLTRPVRLSSPFMATTGAIILAWVFETIVSAFLLKQNDDLGLLGGIVAAATHRRHKHWSCSFCRATNLAQNQSKTVCRALHRLGSYGSLDSLYTSLEFRGGPLSRC